MSKKTKEPSLEKGVVLNGKWEIIDHIGTGGMAEVYRARQINLDRMVAVKILSQDFIDSFEEDEEEIEAAHERFHREVRAMAQVRHPNVLQVYDHEITRVEINGENREVEYIAMEYIPGPNLRSTMSEEGLAGNPEGMIQWIHRYFLPILDGIETVHNVGIVHRDLKPENVLLEGFVPKITDFGLAGGSRWSGLTLNHHMFGTIQYMAPEQFMDMGETDIRGDIYSLGKILYEAARGTMTKETAFPLKTARLPNADTPFLKRLDRVIQQATSEDRKNRIPTAAVFKEALRDLLRDSAARALTEASASMKGFRIGRYRMLLAALVLVAAGSIGFHVLYHSRSREAAGPTESPVSPGHEESAAVEMDRGAQAPVLTARDGGRMHLVPAGEVTIRQGAGDSGPARVELGAFYMDETEVTNHQFVEFLNQVRGRIEVKDGAVRSQGRVWLYIGEVRTRYEPIVYRDGTFHLKDASLASHPVVRVTGYGAEAYAHHFGKRLPTEAEWIRAALGGQVDEKKEPGPGAGSDEMGAMHERMHESATELGKQPGEIVPVIHFPPNANGLRGLKENVKEWGVRDPAPGESGFRYLIFGGGAAGQGSAAPRHPSEAFEDVGFRCVLSVAKRQGP